METTPPLNQAEMALARHHTYTLLSRLYLNGIRVDLLSYLQALPPLAAHLPDSFHADLETNLSEAAADHHNLFGFNVFPFESVFLDPTGLLGGAITERVNNTYQQTGFHMTQNADHIGHELAFLAFLSGAEADAWEDNMVAIAFRMRHIQRDFLQTHLLCWLPCFNIALQRQASPFYAQLAQLTLELGHNHYRDLSLDLMAQSVEPTLSPPPPLGDLSEDSSKVKEIASYLATPPYSGFYISRHDIALLGREKRLPRGFGSRQQMLSNLLRVASQYDELSALFLSVQELLEAWQAAYANIKATQPALAPFTQIWLARTRQTMQLMQEIRFTLK